MAHSNWRSSPNMYAFIYYFCIFLQEVVILSDDEDDSGNSRSVTIKNEPGANSTILNTSTASSSSNMVDLTDEVYDETDVPRHYISWLADLIARAKSKPITVDQRLEVASVSSEVIVIDDSEEDRNKMTNQHESQVASDSLNIHLNILFLRHFI